MNNQSISQSLWDEFEEELKSSLLNHLEDLGYNVDRLEKEDIEVEYI